MVGGSCAAVKKRKNVTGLEAPIQAGRRRHTGELGRGIGMEKQNAAETVLVLMSYL
jgi:hypothetical protein